ncbi:MAG TPA: NAD(P)H-quinone oxidoreductase [Polyangiaceae bacterium]|jgi:putative PIG3 family NAD(P)H quinone oxidoreductase|nr:NAD(P)H-quinone oxidoreductase [Polyangiaceae bacterium]
MRAIVIREPGGPEVLEPREVRAPDPSRGEVRVRVRATAVNRADVLQRMGLYPAPPGVPADIPGLELAGEVDDLGEGVTELAPGDRVFGLVGGGAYAEHVVVHARALARMPQGMSFTDAAAIPEAFLTAWDAMVAQAGLASGEVILVHAAGSGVGTAAFQIALAVGARPIGTARTADKLTRARALGLKDGLVVEKGAFAKEVLARTAGRGADVVLELVGGAYVAEDLACLAPRGRVVVVGTMAGAAVELDLHLLMRKRAELRGTTLRARPLEEKILAARALERHLVPLFESGALRPVVDRVLPLAKAADAHRAMQDNTTFGKVVLEV